jgi:tetratricopeptide (TPR) repeat protein
MNRISSMARWILITAVFCSPGVALSEGPGQPELDRATELQIQAQSMQQLGEVIQLCDAALKKGLDEANQQFANDLLSSTLFQRATLLSNAIFEQTGLGARAVVFWRTALADLERVVTLKPEMVSAHLLIARLHGIPGGDADRGRKAANAAVQLTKEEPMERAKALVARARFREQAEDRLKDYADAIELDPTNADAWRGRAETYLASGQSDKAIEDLQRLLETQPDDSGIYLALSEALFGLEKYDDALTNIDKAIELDAESATAHTMRARVHLMQDDADAALKDLDRSIELQPANPLALLLRGQLRLDKEDLAGAKDDIERVLVLNADLPQALLIRSMIFAEEKRFGDAIEIMKNLLERDPENIGWQLQLAGYYLQDRRPSKGIDLLTKILSKDEDNWIARQARADTFLSVGKHAEAVEDFEVALRLKPDNDSILNNFAWVLATSPDDEVRDGPRAEKLARKACEVTEYKEAHILSTLAAAYAELGDFEKAIEWSKKAVALGVEREEIDDQLKKELESYQQKKPWRERQTVEEREEPIQPRRSRYEA